MSTGFRIFLLMVFGFGAVWVYHVRSDEIRRWLRPGLPPSPPAKAEPFISGVNEILEPEIDLGWLLYKSGEPARPVPALLEGDGDGPDQGAETSSVLTAEEELTTADLPMVEGDGAEEGAALQGAEESASGTSLAGEEEAPETVPFAGSGESAEADSEAAPVAGDGAETQVARTLEGADPSAIVAYEEISYKVESGESLWRIAAKVLGSGIRYREIYELNKGVLKGKTLDSVPAGTQLKIRRVVQKEALKVPATDADTSVERGSARGSSQAARKAVLHTVQRNENLKRIAKRYFPGDSRGWKLIFEANRDRLSSADKVEEGQVLVIPSASVSRPAARGAR